MTQIEHIGHNSVAADQLKTIVERIERLEDDKRAISDAVKDVYTDAKTRGFDAKVMRTLIRMRKESAEDREQRETILETYMHALGMV